jgi:hypothetical protein
MGRSISAVILVGAWVSSWRPQVDEDAWWHVAYGRAIVESGAIPPVERFSWLTEGSPLFLHSWAWDVLLSWADRLGGPTGMSVLGLPFLAAVVGLLWLVIGSVAPAVPPIPRATLVLVAMLAGLGFWGARGLTLDVAFVLATVLVIATYLGRGSANGLVALPVIGLLWANLHGSGVPAFGVCLVTALVAIPLARRLGSWPDRSIRPLAVASGVAVAATLVNPYLFRLWTYPLDRSVASAFSPAIVEWRPPDLAAPELFVARLLLPLALVVLWRTRASTAHPFVILLAAGWTFAALGVARFVPIAAAMLVVAVAASATARWAEEATREESATPPAPGRRLVFVATAAIVAILVVIGAGFITPPAQEAAIAHRAPVAAVEALRAADCPGRLFAAYGWGGYVIRVGEQPVGAYGNSPDGALTEQTAVELVTTDPRPWLEDHAVEVVLVHADGPLSRWLDEADDWDRRYEDGQATIHVRDGAAGCALGRQAGAAGS